MKKVTAIILVVCIAGALLITANHTFAKEEPELAIKIEVSESKSCSNKTNHGKDLIQYRLSQQDPRWGCMPYGTSTYYLGGCGITSITMVNNILTGNILTPPDIGNLHSSAKGMTYAENPISGTDSTLFKEMADQINMEVVEIVNPNIIHYLMTKYRCAAISKQGPGEFTKGGHYIVVADFRDDGTAMVLDPTNENFCKNTSGIYSTIAVTGTNSGCYYVFFNKGSNHPSFDQIKAADSVGTGLSHIVSDYQETENYLDSLGW